MEKLLRFGPALLFCAFVVRIAIAGATFPDVGIASAIMLVIVGLTKFNKDEEIKELNARIEGHDQRLIEVEDHMRKLRSFQDAQKLNSVRPSAKF